jgi:hypothetical protein
MLDFLQKRDLADGRARHALILCLQPDLLESDYAAVCARLGLVDDAIGSLADLFEFHIVIHRGSLDADPERLEGSPVGTRRGTQQPSLDTLLGSVFEGGKQFLLFFRDRGHL